MKKLVTISLAMGALFFVSVSASAQRNMERRGPSNQDDQYDRNDNNGGYERVNNNRPKVTVVLSVGGRPNGGYNDRRYDDRRYNDRRYQDNRRYNDCRRYDRHDRNRGCQPYRRGRY